MRQFHPAIKTLSKRTVYIPQTRNKEKTEKTATTAAVVATAAAAAAATTTTTTAGLSYASVGRRDILAHKILVLGSGDVVWSFASAAAAARSNDGTTTLERASRARLRGLFTKPVNSEHSSLTIGTHTRGQERRMGSVKKLCPGP